MKVSKLEVATEIQAAAIPHALAGRDILGAAKTGSGKTLSFIVPILEKLYREHWSQGDGLGAIVISPTRELALQIFEVLRTVGRRHQFSAGLVTGGKKELEGEQERIVRMNILIATPGRLLQHLEQTSGFDASNIHILVLDEADRILDMGFRSQLDSILEYLSVHRQTLLFSATQTKSVKDLARLSLKQPEYLSVHVEDEEVTPKQLVQNYVVCQLPEKLDVLFSFLKSHLKSKMIVFFSTCAQVRFVYECFCGMQPGIPLSALHGKVKQQRRTMIYMDFLKKSSACLLATDIAARGLDFPNVDWVIQLDAPEDAAMYIHRVGRTARYTATGRALLMLLPHEEEPVVQALSTANVPIKKLTVNPNRKFSVATEAAALLAAQPEARLSAKKAFSSYLRSIQLLPHYPVRDIQTLPLDEFATSLGLPLTPELPMVQATAVEAGREEVRGKKNVNRQLDKLKKQIKQAKEAKKKVREEAIKAKDSASSVVVPEVIEDSDDDDDLLGKQHKKKPKLDKLSKTIAAAKPRSSLAKNVDEDDESGDDFLTVKQVHRWNEGGGDATSVSDAMEVENANDTPLPQHDEAIISKKKQKKMEVKIAKDGIIKVKNAAAPKKTTFNDDGQAVTNPSLTLLSSSSMDEDNVDRRISAYTTSIKERVDAGRGEDEQRDKQRLKEQRLKRKQVVREAKRKNRGEVTEDVDYAGPTLAVADEEEDYGQQDSDDNQTFDNEEDEDNGRNQGKRSRNNDSDDENNDGEDLEALALALLEGKPSSSNSKISKRQKRR